MSETVDIGEIGNYYGGLTVKSENNKFYWSIENWDGFYWEEITQGLYVKLILHQERLTNEH